MRRKVALAVCHRDYFSRGHSRETFGQSAFHWAITVIPEITNGNDCDEYDATDSSEIDQTTWRMINPSMDWYFRVRSDVSLDHNPKTIGRIVIGIIPEEVSKSDIKDLFEAIPLPVKNTHPQQNCVTWALCAVQELQKQGWATSFDIDQFKDWALCYADGRLNTMDRAEIESYPGNQI
ncbi:unnamed protein product [Clonostachys rosea]|uniref:Ubiquitin-like protease family profile domain-containing protein n=1 Tax=Bionectria ochroleuca TaxID=29856 RepID=A0ABY6TR17_BIOOC|nr:unnamed protein product [Clonostachys rosea]